MERPGLENENLMIGFEWLNMNLRKKTTNPMDSPYPLGQFNQ